MLPDVGDLAPSPMVGQSTNTGTTSTTHPPNRGATTGADHATRLVVGSPFPVGGASFMMTAGAIWSPWLDNSTLEGHYEC